jgi:hypothetical protein
MRAYVITGMRWEMRSVAVLFAAFLLVSCNDDKVTGPHVVSFSPFPLEPSGAFAASISPQILPLTLSPLGCPLGRSFTTAFDLVLAPVGSSPFFVDSVTFRLIDGSSRGSSPITVDRGVLTSMFGSTQIIGRRVFAFQPQFACTSLLPVFLSGDVRLLDRFGTAQLIGVNARF